jgi:DNA helicase TIP49 (TBP-interacting protein)
MDRMRLCRLGCDTVLLIGCLVTNKASAEVFQKTILKMQISTKGGDVDFRKLSLSEWYGNERHNEEALHRTKYGMKHSIN